MYRKDTESNNTLFKYSKVLESSHNIMQPPAPFFFPFYLIFNTQCIHTVGKHADKQETAPDN